MGKRFFKFTALISLIFFAINVDVLVDWISGIYYVHCYFSGMQEHHCYPD